MPFETLVARLLTEALRSIVNMARMTSKRRRAAAAISRAIRELFAQKPDFHLAESLVAEARQLLTNPTPDLLRAEQMLIDVREAEERRARKKAVQKKTGRVRKARGKTTKKKVRKSSQGQGARKSTAKKSARKRSRRGK